MQAPGFRMNEREANPNPYVGFIRALKGKKDAADAESVLKAVAAQMKKIMEQRFMFVHTLEEAAFNRVFAGRNWNHGQSIELVLRGPSGRFLPLPYITSVMCHEMNHGPKFQKLMASIKKDVREMQARGYFGDGFWSDGRRLKDSVKMGAEGLKPSDFPEYVCGVSASDAQKARGPRRGPSASQTPGLVKGEASHLSGRQTEYNPKGARRVNVDMGENGTRLDGKREITKEDRAARKTFIDEEVDKLVKAGLPITRAKTVAIEMYDKLHPWYKEGSTFGKKAKSKTAVEMRAEAAERRLAALQPKLEPPEEDIAENGTLEIWDLTSEEDVPDPHTDPQARKREMEESMTKEELHDLKGGWEDYVITSPKKRAASPSAIGSSSSKKTKQATLFGAQIIKEEQLRGLGLASSSSGKSSRTSRQAGATMTVDDSPARRSDESSMRPESPSTRPGWTCKLCTFINVSNNGRCEMCRARPDGTIPSDV
ncbi:WLM domain-domain-containing protein [Naematelia encephala]|uniref:WLM domain-domain-containing protein n=1 Tax=Naematelia encephala TaxID=71784 RepID=A0A1Y2AKY1_9TREE|nr:WLM domain-domain-containing protein [Naematelia encephala]